MNRTPSAVPVEPSESVRSPVGEGASPARAMAAAFSHTVGLLFSPFDARRWVKLSLICVFLGGGASSAAIHWSLRTLPAESAFGGMLDEVREFLTERPALVLFVIALGLVLGLLVFYVRALCRFALVDTILKQEVQFRQAWREFRPLAHSYFRWLLGLLLAVGTALAVGALVVFPVLRTASVTPSPVPRAVLLAVLVLVEVLVVLGLTLLLTLTDDLAVPLMYAERLPLPAAWGQLWRCLRAEPEAFTLYVLLRFVVSIGVGVAVMLLLFPALVALFSGAVIVAALVVLTLRLAGLAWVWNPVTLFLALLHLLAVTGALLLLVSVAGMPGQVFFQNFGMHFVGARVPSLGALLPVCQATRRQEQDHPGGSTDHATLRRLQETRPAETGHARE